MDTSKYTFRIEYQDGLKVTPYNLEDPETEFLLRIYINKSKVNSKLVWDYNGAGGKWIEEEFINSEDFSIGWGEAKLKSNHFYSYYYKGYSPYIIEIHDLSIEDDNKLVYKEYFDPRQKLVNFTLHSDNPETLHTWMCAIEKFKKENECDISVVNNYLKENQKYDFVDCYWNTEENFGSFYAGYQIGRFSDENAPNFFLNPDGLKGKNDLEIIEDILYHYTRKL